MSSVSDELSPAGWPRPWLLWTPPEGGSRAHLLPQILPVPWINGAHPYRGDWVSFDDARADRAHRERLCAVCGQPLERIAVLGRAGEDSTSGPGCHPRCMQLTLTACPHFTAAGRRVSANAAVAWRVDGPELGYAPAEDPEGMYAELQRVADGLPELTVHDVQWLAGIDPWGTGRQDTIDADDTVADD